MPWPSSGRRASSPPKYRARQPAKNDDDLPHAHWTPEAAGHGQAEAAAAEGPTTDGRIEFRAISFPLFWSQESLPSLDAAKDVPRPRGRPEDQNQLHILCLVDLGQPPPYDE